MIRYIIKFISTISIIVMVFSCGSYHSISFDFVNDAAGLGSGIGVDIIEMPAGQEVSMVSRSLIDTFRDLDVSFVNLNDNLQLSPRTSYKTDYLVLNSELISSHNASTETSNQIRQGPNYRMSFVVDFVIDQEELRFRMKNILEVKGLGQGDYRRYNGNYSNIYFFNFISSKLKNNLITNDE